MANEDIKAIVARIPLEIFNQGKLAVIDEVLSADFVDHATPPGQPGGRDGLKTFVTALRAAFPRVAARSRSRPHLAARWYRHRPRRGRSSTSLHQSKGAVRSSLA